MKQLTIYKHIKISKEMEDILTLLKSKYKVNCSQFIRQAINDKLDKDLPEIKNEFDNKIAFKYPF